VSPANIHWSDQVAEALAVSINTFSSALTAVTVIDFVRLKTLVLLHFCDLLSNAV
jgi:hypothetical protein